MINSDLVSALIAPISTENPWSDSYKIPWNDSAFSARMLREHLSQEHDLASRRDALITQQADWLKTKMFGNSPTRVLDIGCGPGLYAAKLIDGTGYYKGIDFGPASIEYALKHYGAPGDRDFVLGNILEKSFGGPYDIVVFLYGEFNAFPPKDVRTILNKIRTALAPGGTVVLEVHTFEAIVNSGKGRSWYACENGLFGTSPHLCLQDNYWLSERRVAQQVFSIIERENKVQRYYNTLQGYMEEEYLSLLQEAGFKNMCFHGDWVAGNDALRLLTATNPN